MFSEKGYHQTLISDIVAKARVGQGTFYRSFKSKRDLMDRMMDRFGQMLLEQFDSMTIHLPANVQEYRQASIDAILAMADLLEKHRKLALLLLREAPTIDRDIEKRINDLSDQFAGLAAFYLEYAIEKGYVRPCNKDIVAQAVVGMGIRQMMLWLNEDSATLDVRTLVTELVDFAFYGFGVKLEPEKTDEERTA